MTVSVWFFIYAAVVRAVVKDKVHRLDFAEGETATLRADLVRKKMGDVILWTFGPGGTVLAQLVNRDKVTISAERFRNRLKLDTHTGALTISNISINDSGEYKVQIISIEVSSQQYSVYVYAPVSIPAIKNISEISECTSEFSDVSISDPCTVLCSVTNGPMVTLSWTRGQDTLTQSSNPDRSVLLCVLLEVKDNQDNSIYSCVASNPVSNHSVQLNITEICPLLGQSRVHCCGTVELVVRLYLSVVVGLAILAILVYHFRSM